MRSAIREKIKNKKSVTVYKDGRVKISTHNYPQQYGGLEIDKITFDELKEINLDKRALANEKRKERRLGLYEPRPYRIEREPRRG